MTVVADEVFHIEAERQARLEAEQEYRDNILEKLRENLALISNNNNFNEYNMDVLISLRRMILQDNEQPINRLTVLTYILDLESLISILRDRNVHSDLKHLCENIFEEMYEKLANEKKLIEDGFTRHNEYDTTYLNEELNRLNSIYDSFMYTINNGTHTR
jgi:hypothetical protein